VAVEVAAGPMSSEYARIVNLKMMQVEKGPRLPVAAEVLIIVRRSTDSRERSRSPTAHLCLLWWDTRIARQGNLPALHGLLG
jgi:hypothetical protein